MPNVFSERSLLFFVNFRSNKYLLLFYLLTFIISYLMLVNPGQSYTEVWYTDVMALLNATYRVSLGQVPGTDFWSSIGPINFYLSAIGLITGYAPGVTFAIGSIAALFLILSPGLLMMQRRFSLPAILLSSVLIWLIIVVPLGSGEAIGNFTAGMFYNRHAWAALFFILLFYVEPREITKHSKWLDSGLLAILVLFELYCKITYGLVAIAFIFANMFISKYNRSVSLLALFFIIIGMGLVELTLEIHQGYINSIVNIVNSRGSFRSSLGGIVVSIIEHANSLVIVFLAILYNAFLGRNKFFDWLYVIGCSAVCIVLLDQNGGVKGIPALMAILVCLGELIRRHEIKIVDKNNNRNKSVSSGALISLILLIVFISEPLTKRGFSLYSQYRKIIKLEPLPNAPQKLATFLVPAPDKTLTSDLLEDPQINSDSLGKIRSTIVHSLNTSQYYDTIIDGTELLNKHKEITHEVFVLDLADPFLFTLDLIPQKNAYPFKWWWPAEEPSKIFNEVIYVMEPLIPYQTLYSDNHRTKYSKYLNNNYEILDYSRNWQLWKKIIE